MQIQIANEYQINFNFIPQSPITPIVPSNLDKRKADLIQHMMDYDQHGDFEPFTDEFNPWAAEYVASAEWTEEVHETFRVNWEQRFDNDPEWLKSAVAYTYGQFYGD